MERCASAQDSVWALTRTLEQERQVLSARTLSAGEQRISERARPVLCESKGKGDSRSRIILIYFRTTKMRSQHLAVK